MMHYDIHYNASLDTLQCILRYMMHHAIDALPYILRYTVANCVTLGDRALCEIIYYRALCDVCDYTP